MRSCHFIGESFEIRRFACHSFLSFLSKLVIFLSFLSLFFTSQLLTYFLSISNLFSPTLFHFYLVSSFQAKLSS
jgi:hypothetical protein